MDECERLLKHYGGWSLREVLGDEDALRRMDVVQPALFAVMVSLAEVWRSAGLEPDAVIGHSQGEIAAATAAGILSLADGVRLIVARARVITEKLSGRGLMAVLDVPADQVDRTRVSVGAVNSPGTVVISGDPDGVRAAVADCQARRSAPGSCPSTTPPTASTSSRSGTRCSTASRAPRPPTPAWRSTPPSSPGGSTPPRSTPSTGTGTCANRCGSPTPSRR
ncbi:acyltransferase domain-containing protein [Streptomyces sp. M19]